MISVVLLWSRRRPIVEQVLYRSNLAELEVIKNKVKMELSKIRNSLNYYFRQRE